MGCPDRSGFEIEALAQQNSRTARVRRGVWYTLAVGGRRGGGDANASEVIAWGHTAIFLANASNRIEVGTLRADEVRGVDVPRIVLTRGTTRVQGPRKAVSALLDDTPPGPRLRLPERRSRHGRSPRQSLGKTRVPNCAIKAKTWTCGVSGAAVARRIAACLSPSARPRRCSLVVQIKSGRRARNSRLLPGLCGRHRLDRSRPPHFLRFAHLR